jgi:KUP system potassium uptake protein
VRDACLLQNKDKTSIMLALAFQSLGVIYGDVGTSPLYVYSETYVLNQNPAGPSKEDLVGVLSLIIWTLTLIPLVKYVFIVLWAGDRGNGGTFALYSLVCRHARINTVSNQSPEDRELSTYKLDLPTRSAKRAANLKGILERSKVLQQILLLMALVGTCAVIGDGVFTPAISVLSAISGIQVPAPNLSQGVVTGISCAILFVLFMVQRFGTDKVGYTFAPIVLVWFLSIGLTGLYNIFKHDPSVLKAFNPAYIFTFFTRNKKAGWISLGGIVLCITGTEAMFADLCHFSVRSIQLGFTTLVYPFLLMAYIGQAAYLSKHPEHISQTFYKSIPSPLFWPMFVVATAAAIIASQAMISATYSIIDQSIALSCFPRLKVIHTSEKYHGQIYVPEINYILMVITIVICIAFKGSTSLIGDAYGIAVVSVMVVTTTFLTLIMILVWQVNLWIAIAFSIFFGSIELVYFSSCLYKVPEGGYTPLIIGSVALFIMCIWHYARKRSYDFEVRNKISLDWVLALGPNLGGLRVPGVGLIYTELAQGIPAIFSHLISNLPSMHSVLVFVCVKHLPVPNIPDDERFLLRRVGPQNFRIFRCVIRFGYKDYHEDIKDFEELLFANLSKFIRTEHIESWQPPSSGGLQDDTRPDGATAVTVEPFSEDSTNHSLVFGSQSSQEEYDLKQITPLSTKTSLESIKEGLEVDEVRYLHEVRRKKVAYILGHTDVRAQKDSNVVRKVVIDDIYGFLRRNSRSNVMALNIPQESLLQVGMINYI